MTVIACKDGVMAADSCSFSGSVRYQMAPGQRKIVRAQDGSLVGVGGSGADTYPFRQWVLAGMDFGALPTLRYTDPDSDDAVQWLWLKPDGSLWRGDCGFRSWPEAAPMAIGESCAAWMAEGAMRAGASAAEAVAIAIKHTIYVGGDVQVEELRGVVQRVAA